MKHLMYLALFTLLLGSGPALAQDATGTIDHAIFDAVLKRSVKGDKVDYFAIKGNPGFPRYVEMVGNADLTQIKGKKAQLAFYINAYNALTIHQVLSVPGIKSVMKVPDFFKKRIHKLAGKMVSLDDIENKIIRPTFNEPRIHAALNCASVSCPPLADFAFTAEKLEKQLDQMFRAFANDNSRNAVDPATGALKLSKILDWYGVDFGAGGAPAYLARFVKPGPRKAAAQGRQCRLAPLRLEPQQPLNRFLRDPS